MHDNVSPPPSTQRIRPMLAPVVTGLALALTVVVGTALDAGVARACSPPVYLDGCVTTSCSPSAWPEDGAIDVPLGTEVRVEWSCPVFLDTPWRVLPTSFRLRRVSDDVILPLVATESGRFRPTSALDADTEYVLEDLDHTSGCSEPTVFTSIASFRTGTALDTELPLTPVPCILATSCSYGSCRDGACCGLWSFEYRAVEWTGDPDDIYELAVGGSVAHLARPSARFGTSTSGMFGYRPGGTTFPAGTVVITAIDPSGNRSAPSTPLVVSPCPSPPETGLDASVSSTGGDELTECGWTLRHPDADRPDGGGVAADPLDAGTGSMDGSSSALRAAGGCSATRASATTPARLFGPLLAMLAIARWRHASRSARSA